MMRTCLGAMMAEVEAAVVVVLRSEKELGVCETGGGDSLLVGLAVAVVVLAAVIMMSWAW